MNLCYRIACVNNLYMKYVKSILNAYVIPLLIFFFLTEPIKSIIPSLKNMYVLLLVI